METSMLPKPGPAGRPVRQAYVSKSPDPQVVQDRGPAARPAEYPRSIAREPSRRLRWAFRRQIRPAAGLGSPMWHFWMTRCTRSWPAVAARTAILAALTVLRRWIA